jgi:nucleotide sugar dehydrogenase
VKISIIGLGVGYSLGVTLASIGIKTIGVDINPQTVAKPRFDATIAKILHDKDAQVKKNLVLSTSYAEIENSDFVLMVVNTDYKNHTLDIAHVISATKEVIKKKTGTLVVLSTLPYGASKQIANVIDNRIGYVYVPMMVAQGNLLDTFINPAFLAFGAYEEKYAQEVMRFYKEWLAAFNGKMPETFIVTPEEAELAKLVSNAFTSTKMTFANMCGELFEKLGINGERIMKVVSTNPTIGPRFFKPGYAFGGQCFPRDLDTLITLIGDNKIESGILKEVQNYNLIRTNNPISICPNIFHGRTLILGIVYKSGIADTRFSPSLELFNELKKNGSIVYAYDPNLNEFNSLVDLSGIQTVVIATSEPQNNDIIKKLKGQRITILDYANMIDETDVDQNWSLFKAGRGWIKHRS